MPASSRRIRLSPCSCRGSLKAEKLGVRRRVPCAFDAVALSSEHRRSVSGDEEGSDGDFASQGGLPGLAQGEAHEVLVEGGDGVPLFQGRGSSGSSAVEEVERRRRRCRQGAAARSRCSPRRQRRRRRRRRRTRSGGSARADPRLQVVASPRPLQERACRAGSGCGAREHSWIEKTRLFIRQCERRFKH